MCAIAQHLPHFAQRRSHEGRQKLSQGGAEPHIRSLESHDVVVDRCAKRKATNFITRCVRRFCPPLAAPGQAVRTPRPRSIDIAHGHPLRSAGMRAGMTARNG